MKFILISALALLLTSCGSVLEYDTGYGVTIRERIDGKLNPTFSINRVGK